MKRGRMENKRSNFLKTNIIFLAMLFFVMPYVYSKNEDNTKSSMAVLERLIGNRAKEFDLQILENKDQNNLDSFELETI